MDMVYLVIKMFYPSHKAEEVAQVSQEMTKKYPPDMSIYDYVVPASGRATEKGLEGMSVLKLKEGKFDAAAKRIVSIMAMFNKIEGFEYSVEIWSSPEDS